MDEVKLARMFYAAELLGGVFYDRFAARVDNQDVAGTFVGFGQHEHHHATWYAEWLKARGHEPQRVHEALVVPVLAAALRPLTLESKLRAFAQTEAAAARHLTFLAKKVRDPELKAIIEKTIPFEQNHAHWFEREGHRMLRPRDRKVKARLVEAVSGDSLLALLTSSRKASR